jgi:hypothetical protein
MLPEPGELERLGRLERIAAYCPLMRVNTDAHPGRGEANTVWYPEPQAALCARYGRWWGTCLLTRFDCQFVEGIESQIDGGFDIKWADRVDIAVAPKASSEALPDLPLGTLFDLRPRGPI